MTVYEKIDRALKQHENHKYAERSLESIASYLDWAWKWRKITEEQKEQLKADIESERISLAFSEYYDQWLASSDVVWTEEGEAWKFDQEAYNAYLNPAEDEAPEEEPEAEAVPAD